MGAISKRVTPATLMSVLMCALALSGKTQDFSTFEKSGFHFRTGVNVRQVGISHSFGPVTPLRLGRFFSTGTGRGDVGLFTSVPGLPLTYADGTITAEGFPGLASAVINDITQSVPTGRQSFVIDSDISRVTFSSRRTEFSDTLTGSQAAAPSSSDEEAAMPYAEWVFPLKESGQGFLRFVFGYGFLSTGSDSGSQPTATQSMRATTTTYLYHYDHLGTFASTDDFPFATQTILFDAAAALGSGLGGDLRDPTTSQRVSQTDRNFLAVSRSLLDVDLHEVPLGLEWGKRAGRCDVALRAGLTLNAVDLDLVTRTDWFKRGTTDRIASIETEESTSKFAIGAYIGASVTFPLNEDGTIYLRAHGTYHWVDGVSVSTGNGMAAVELSSWEGGLGLGFVFN